MADGSREMAEYRRKGVVRAHRLDAPRTWRTANGDVLQAAAGDWWVVGADGQGRSVAQEAFAQTYASDGGDRYRRTGVVTARQADRTEVVATLEGEAVAEPGMWIVTDGAGRSWPVPDDEFHRGYEAVE